ncbi:hypothetical protein [Hutsoniella sourekii]|uniref:hypothetical protein n=1 Tax=Hutsoniella sourekii TaxID=87650 RepID=UPI000484381F|nr:hypothetical protein [Hutsoniella sourekii]
MKHSLSSRVSQTLLCATALSFVALINQVEVQAEEVLPDTTLASSETPKAEETVTPTEAAPVATDEKASTLNSENLENPLQDQETGLETVTPVTNESQDSVSDHRTDSADLVDSGDQAEPGNESRTVRLYAAPQSTTIAQARPNHFAAKANDQAKLKIEGQDAPVDISKHEVRAIKEQTDGKTTSVYVHVLGKIFKVGSIRVD